MSLVACPAGQPTGPAVLAVMRAYLERGESNVALLNWERLAADETSSVPNSYINWAAPNARQVNILIITCHVIISHWLNSA